MARRAEAARPPRARGRRALRGGAALLDDAGLAYEVDPTLVRGLDYYTRTVFEFESERAGRAERRSAAAAATTGWSSSSAARPRPGVGWAAGVERILLAAEDEAEAPAARRVRRRAPARAPRATAFALARRGCATPACAREMEQAGRSLKGQLKQADRIGARRRA